MKKFFVLIIVMALAAGFAACGTPTETTSVEESASAATQQATPESTEAPTSEPTEEPTPQPTPEQPQPPQPPQSNWQAIETILYTPQELFGERVEQMGENEGGQFGFVETKQLSEDGSCFRFISENEAAYMPFNTRFKDFDDGGSAQQAFCMRFMPDPAENLSFTLMGMAEAVISFEGDGAYFTYVQEGEKFHICDYSLEQGRWYNVLIATDENMMLRVLTWDDENFDNHMYYERSLYIGADDIFESNWKVTIGFDAGGTLCATEYSIYTFESFTENPPVVASVQGGDQGSDNSEGEPSWSVRIGDFDAMSEGITDNVDTTDLDIAGSPCVGYQLNALVVFANGDASLGATVVFEDGSTEDVPELGDAFVVFMRDGQHLAKPHLGFQDTVYENPVMEIQLNE